MGLLGLLVIPPQVSSNLSRRPFNFRRVLSPWFDLRVFLAAESRAMPEHPCNRNHCREAFAAAQGPSQEDTQGTPVGILRSMPLICPRTDLLTHSMYFFRSCGSLTVCSSIPLKKCAHSPS
ncbi:hypothetical protein IE53DRAFT_275381 [Violaceomyces palustris]|uniref:Uncharacterized protein n=1 Tax=Violaceomyces palustris TaxID=1673888 RepID=A0ACD0P7T0_9BASI|nr:hypothetical protein IE53DRAFT_275381 [Violaceomyces palustris]